MVKSTKELESWVVGKKPPKNALYFEGKMLECIEDGKPAIHLHGEHEGLEPCCGQHADCDRYIGHTAMWRRQHE